jgi:hypothetical protein
MGESSHAPPELITSVLIDLQAIAFRPLMMLVSINSQGA